MGSLWKRQTNRASGGNLRARHLATPMQKSLARPEITGRVQKVKSGLAHVDENTVRHIIGQADDVVDHLLIMRFNFPFNISFM